MKVMASHSTLKPGLREYLVRGVQFFASVRRRSRRSHSP